MSGAEAWGLISDVHGNLPALERAIALLRGEGATRLAFLGDYLGRGDSDGCVALIRRSGDMAIVGNRDLDWQDRVAPETKRWVLSLPRTAQAGKLVLSHGDARLTPALSTAQIPRGFTRAHAELDAKQAQVWAFGHSHHARLWRHHLGAVALIAAEHLRLENEARYYVNVGTTGLPFPGKGKPSVALVDFEKGEIRQIPLESG